MRIKNSALIAILLTGCQLTPPPVDPSLAHRRKEADKAVVQAENDAADSDSKVTELRDRELELEARRTEKAQLTNAHAQRVSAAKTEVERHEDAISRAQALGKSCKKGTVPSDNEAIALHDYLVPFQSNPARDEAIKASKPVGS